MLKTSKLCSNLAARLRSFPPSQSSSSSRAFDSSSEATACSIHHHNHHQQPCNLHSQKQLSDSGSQHTHFSFEGLRQLKFYGSAETWQCLNTLKARFYCDPPSNPLPPERLSRPRGSLWRSRKGISREAQLVVRDLRRYKADGGRVAQIFGTAVSRLLKIDILATMKELQRENEAKLALQVFNKVRKEYWYKPDIFLYKDMMNALAVSKQVHEVEKLFDDLKKEGLQPELNIYTEMLRAYLYANMPSRVMEIVEEMKQLGYPPDELAHRLLWKYLNRCGHRDLAIRLRHEYNQAFEAPSEEGAKF